MRTSLLTLIIFGATNMVATATTSQPDSVSLLRSRTSAAMAADASVETYSTDDPYEITPLQLPREIPPSPTAASLGAYGAIPVGHYTGIPEISIPLYEIVVGEVRVPITLSYHASGIRVADEAGWAGMGWTLNAGGAITRSVAGVDDFNDTNYKLLQGHPKAPEVPSLNDPYISLNSLGYEISPIALVKPDIRDIFSNMLTVICDTKPDVFSYNLGGYSGQMVFPKKTYGMDAGTFPSPVIQNRDPVIMNYHRNGYYGEDRGEWVADTPNGAHYYFGTAELTRDTTEMIVPHLAFAPENRQPQVYTAWYLDKIVGPYNETVEFTYAVNSKIQSQRQGYYDHGRYTHTSPLGLKIHNIQTHAYSTSIHDEILLQEIRFPGGKVIFKTQDRTDLLHRGNKAPQALSEMLIINDQRDTLKRIEFRMGYYNDHSSSTMDRRLRLDGIVENGERVWNFVYDQGYLPPKNSVMVDYWGYYNNSGISWLCPVEDIPLSMCIRPRGLGDYMVFNLGADRNSSEAALNGILTRIDYPTGGSTEFEYELHDFSPAYSDSDDFYSEFKYKYELIQDSRHENDELIVNFTITMPAPIHCLAIVRYSEGLPCSSTSIGNQPYINFNRTDFTQVDIAWRLERKNANGNWYLIDQRYWGDITCADVISRTEAAWNLCGVGRIFEPGDYRIIMPTFNNTRANVEMVIPHLKGTKDYRGGGARIKSIRDMDGCDTLVRQYTYCDEDGWSTGVPHYYPKTFLNYPSNYDASQNYLHSASTSVPGNGINVAYRQMTETVFCKDTVAYQTERWFYDTHEPQLFRVFNGGVPARVFHENGRPKIVIDRNANGEVIRRTDYQYLRDERSCDTIVGYHSSSFYTGYLVAPFRHCAAWWYLDNERTVFYEHGKPMVTSIKYGYNNEFRQQTSKTTTFADRQTLREEWGFPFYTGKYSYLIDRLVGKNVYQNSTLISSIRKNLDSNRLTGVLIKTDSLSDYESRIVVKWHNNYSNPIWVIKDGIESTVYIWSYIGQYPIAEILNATIEEVMAALNSEGDLQVFNRIADQVIPDMTPINALREKLPDAQVNTYTYKSLVGILTVTDPAGRTIHYDYDPYGRLLQIRDDAGNPVQSYEYHYKQ